MSAKAMGKNRVVVYHPANPLPLIGGVSRMLHDLMPSTQTHRRNRDDEEGSPRLLRPASIPNAPNVCVGVVRVGKSERRAPRMVRRRDEQEEVEMPPRGVKKGSKRARQYEHIRDSLEEREAGAKSGPRRSRPAPVNKERARHGEAATSSRLSKTDMSSGRRGGVRAHRSGPAWTDTRPAVRGGEGTGRDGAVEDEQGPAHTSGRRRSGHSKRIRAVVRRRRSGGAQTARRGVLNHANRRPARLAA